MTEKDPLLAQIADYYSSKLSAYGRTSRGVDWNTQESQELRFAQLAKLFSPAPSGTDPGSVNDYGCGFGSFLNWMKRTGLHLDYHGCDISGSMVEAAREALGDHFSVGAQCPRQADFSIASGIFNVKLSADLVAWESHIFRTIDLMAEQSRRGFAFNCLTSYSDPERMRGDLYYSDPCRFFDHCKRRFSRNVALLHDYGLYEFTLIVRKEYQDE